MLRLRLVLAATALVLVVVGCGESDEAAIDTYCGVVARTTEELAQVPAEALTSNNLTVVQEASATYERVLREREAAAPGPIKEAYATIRLNRDEPATDEARGREDRESEAAGQSITTFEAENCG